MPALWAAPPGVLIAGSLAVVVQLRRIAAARSVLADAAQRLESDRIVLARLVRATEGTRASLEGLKRR